MVIGSCGSVAELAEKQARLEAIEQKMAGLLKEQVALKKGASLEFVGIQKGFFRFWG